MNEEDGAEAMDLSHLRGAIRVYVGLVWDADGNCAHGDRVALRVQYSRHRDQPGASSLSALGA